MYQPPSHTTSIPSPTPAGSLALHPSPATHHQVTSTRWSRRFADSSPQPLSPIRDQSIYLFQTNCSLPPSLSHLWRGWQGPPPICEPLWIMPPLLLRDRQVLARAADSHAQCSSLKCAHAFQCEGGLQNNHTPLNLSKFFLYSTLHQPKKGKPAWYWLFCVEYKKDMMSHYVEEVDANKMMHSK